MATNAILYLPTIIEQKTKMHKFNSHVYTITINVRDRNFYKSSQKNNIS